MPLRSALLLALLGVVGMTTRSRAQETATAEPTGAAPAAETTASAGPRLVLFTEAEMARFQAIADEMAAKRETYIRASEEDEIVLLEPYIVVGDSSLMRARIRRALEQRSGSQRRILSSVLAPSVQRDLLAALRFQDAFFGPSSPGRPADAPSFHGIDMLELPGRLRPSKLRELFRAPPE